MFRLISVTLAPGVLSVVIVTVVYDGGGPILDGGGPWPLCADPGRI